MTQIQQQLHKNTRRSSPVGVSVQNTTLAQQFTKKVNAKQKKLSHYKLWIWEKNSKKKFKYFLTPDSYACLNCMFIVSHTKKKSYSFVNVECYRPHLFLYV